MKFGADLGIRAVSTWLPETTESIKAEVDGGRLDAGAVELLGVTDVPVTADLAAPQMAVLAGRKVLGRAGCDPASVGILVHAWVYHQGQEVWSPAHYVASELDLPPDALPTGMHELCNGGTSALYFAASGLLANPDLTAALVTTADRFVAPVWDRWRMHTDIAYGDGATAALLHRRDGRPDELRLLSLTHASAGWLEALNRGDAPFTTAPMEGKEILSSAQARREFYAAHGKESLAATARDRVGTSLRTALAQAELDADDPRLKMIVTPRLGPRLLHVMYDRALGEQLLARTVQLGTRTGHLGAGDMVANMADIVEQKMLEPGEYAVILGCGSGFTWSTAVVQAP
ncbi:3-oxoacyl-(Acyl-carrier-protein) synthase-3 [Frankia canadensis]|uniref:3-oxoacyl-(Acyl-carrier-protein) synthase-3 n=1 Tax=Frankia canadensis TaxID=1836972 RepID=A0A2I2KNB3_9ACTN|nr:ketoacyl-ACP synthase III family protein [Frankia canadensis]SNQ47161.1 3-oxoacyl-(Acyl-carrier-protein) synthase-3 [Frankia canadensis]SOU54451.1 3-oxoacyl-(Acyl-carrier-protein) synthase-3 [Frankia canadensis]